LGPERVERKLAAILAADVAGYSRLMGADEEGTHAALMALRGEVSDPKIAQHRGRIVKTTGDGFLAEFASVVDAVRCAIELLREVALRNDDVPSERRIQFRIGINIGDIIIEADDIYGDGVNVAARLETLAEPAAFASRRSCLTRSRAGSIAPSRILASRASRTLPGRSESTASNRKLRRRRGQVSSRHPWRCRKSRRSQCSRSRTCPATPSRNISPTAWPRRSSFRNRHFSGVLDPPPLPEVQRFTRLILAHRHP
jgi:class 3 adenylate cyclase